MVYGVPQVVVNMRLVVYCYYLSFFIFPPLFFYIPLDTTTCPCYIIGMLQSSKGDNMSNALDNACKNFADALNRSALDASAHYIHGRVVGQCKKGTTVYKKGSTLLVVKGRQ